MTLRVVHACAYFAPAWVYGGPPTSLLGLCRAQAKAGLDVQVVTTTANGSGELPAEVAARREYDGIPVRYCARAMPRWMFRAPGVRQALDEALRGADVLHIHGFSNVTVWMAAGAARRHGVPYVLSPRGMLEPAAKRHHRWRKRAAYLAIDRRVLRGAALLHATSEAEAATLCRRVERPIVYVPNGVAAPPADACSAAAVRQQYGLPAEAPLILFLGRLHPIKRLDLLAGAFVRLRERHRDVRLVLAGPDEAGLAPQLREILGQAAAAVTLTGAVDEPVKWGLLAASAALVLCSESESFGMSAAEAMAAARPVVVTRDLPWEHVAAAGAGFVMEPTEDAIADALAMLIGDREAAAAMGLRAQALVREAHSWARAADALTDAYARVLRADA